MADNFDLSRLSQSTGDQGWYGKGIYFSEFPETALFYGKELLGCRILPGRSYDLTGDKRPELTMVGMDKEPGFDSHRVNCQSKEGYGEEIVIFDQDQILPVYWIHYELKKALSIKNTRKSISKTP